jgi:hypothetical protein
MVRLTFNSLLIRELTGKFRDFYWQYKEPAGNKRL